MSKITVELNAERRKDIGKGASRRLRRLESKVPGIIYGGEQEPLNITLVERQLKKVMEHESFYTSMLHVHIEGDTKSKETVVVKAIQRHPYKAQILHIDLQRVSGDDIIIKKVPLHFVKASEAQAVKLGGLVSHIMSEIEVECKVKDLPEFVEVDLSKLELDHILHLSDVKLPKHISLTVDVKDELHNLPVASIHMPKAVEEESDEAPVAAPEVPTVAETEGKADE